jgi:hypothetical protein
MDTFPPDTLRGRDLIYFKLHGLKDEPYWYGDNWETALHVSVFDNLKLPNTIIFVANCFFAESPFLKAILETGATVIGGNGENFAQGTALIGADLLGRSFRQALQRGARPARALRLAKLYLTGKTTLLKRSANRATNDKRKSHLKALAAANQDTLGFQIYTQDSILPAS